MLDDLKLMEAINFSGGRRTSFQYPLLQRKLRIGYARAASDNRIKWKKGA